MRLFLAIILAACSCSAQQLFWPNLGLGITAAGPIDIPSSIGLTISNRWMSSTLSNNTVVSDWVDVTNSFHWVQTTGANQPTNTLTGVHFGGVTYLEGTNVFIDGALITLIIYQFDTNNIISVVPFVNNPNGSKVTGIAAFGAAPFTWHLQNGNQDLGAQSVSVRQNFIAGEDANHWYTNGVAAPVISGSLDGWGGHASPCRIGGGTGGGFTGYIREVIVFTNKTISASQVSNLNYYANSLP